MQWTIGRKLLGSALLGGGLSVIVGAAGLIGGYRSAKATDEIQLDAVAIRKAMTADMMHDALRGDVLRAMVVARTSAGERQAVVDDLESHIRAFEESLSDTTLRLQGPTVQGTLEAMRPARDAYLAGARAMVKLALEDPKAAAGRYDEFQTVFTQMEEKMERLGDAIERVSEASAARSDQAQAEARVVIVLSLLVGAIVVLGLSQLMSRGITGGIRATADAIDRMAEGDLTVRLASQSKDETGQMATALNRALEQMQTTMQAITVNAQTLAGASEELASVSTRMGSNAEETSAQSGVVSAAAEQVSKNVQTVATGTEEMSASIKEIAKNATDAARVAGNAVRVAETTNATITKLGDSSAEIGQVIKVITSIAEQTNLLALNATIEAARAGEAGKGFAVVANEVKELAKATAKATEEIGQKIQAIQTDTQGAVAAIGEITAVIAQINEIQTTIAGAVEEQAATTNEIGRNVMEAAKGSSEIAQNITGVAEAAQSTTSGAAQTQTAAAELARLASELQGLVQQFRVDDHAAGQPGRARAGHPSHATAARAKGSLVTAGNASH